MATSCTATPSPAEPTTGAAAPAFFSPSEPSCTANKNIVEASYASASPSFEPFYKESDKEESAQENEQHEHDNDDVVGFWQLLLTLYLPIALVWMRRSMFGAVNLLRSLLLGHLLRLIVGFISSSTSSEPATTKRQWWDTLREASWLQPFLDSKKADPHAWPPPALTTLAILTILAFIVHPDGLTWIMLGKLRDGILSFFTHLGKALGTMMDTYGILVTLVASATLSALAFVGVIVYRTLSPRRRPTTVPQPRKKKRKGNHKSRQRIRNHASPKSSAKQKRGPTPKPLAEPLSPPGPLSLKPPTPPSPPSPLVEDAPSHSEEKPARGRIVSTSTLDTFLVDDQSCDESTSARSISSAPTASVKPVKQQQSPIGRSNKPKRKQRRKQTYNERRGKAPEQPPSPSLNSERNSRGRLGNNVDDTRKGGAVLPDYRGYTSSSFFSGGDDNNSQSFFSQGVSANRTTLPSRRPEQTLRYNVPNYGAGDGRYTPGKLELAAFLARVGLVGTACAGLLEDLPNVDALEWLSPMDFETKYQVSALKLREIQILLEARRQERAWRTNSASTSQPPLRPPPGLGGLVSTEKTNNNSMVVGMERVAVGSNNATSLPVAKSTDSSFPAFQQSSFGNTKSPPRASFEPQQLPTVEPFGAYGGVTAEEEEDSQIEQELQELGGQMVTSVLDF